MDSKKSFLVMILPLLAFSSQPLASQAQAGQTVQIFVDGRLVTPDPPAIILGGRLMVPLRRTFEAMGATVSFFRPRTIIVTRDSRVIELEIGRPAARVNDRPTTLDVPPIVLGGHTRIPLRFVGEALGAAVYFDRPTRTVEILTPPPTDEALPAPQPTPAPGPIPPLPPVVVQPAPSPEPVRPPRPTVIFPLPGTSVGNPVAVQGAAAGAARVRVTISVPLLGVPIGSADAGVLPVIGLFSASVSYPSLFSGLPLTITVVSIDGGGVESEPVTVIVRQG